MADGSCFGIADAHTVFMNRPLNVLIVDDVEVCRAATRIGIRACGAPVARLYEAADGLQALEILEANPIDVVFTDLEMPGMNGIELLRHIWEREWTHLTTMVISTTGAANRSVSERILELGVKFISEKPPSVALLRTVLETARDRLSRGGDSR